MSEVLFYHLTSSPVEAALPGLLSRSLERGWKVLVRGNDAARMEALDRHLWTFRDDSFLPHGSDEIENVELQPIVLTVKNECAVPADILMLVDGARAKPGVAQDFERVCIFFDGNDPDAVALAREDWTAYKDAGLGVKYWAQEGGTWVQKG